ALVAALEAELAAEVAELAELAAAEAGDAAARAQVVTALAEAAAADDATAHAEATAGTEAASAETAGTQRAQTAGTQRAQTADATQRPGTQTTDAGELCERRAGVAERERPAQHGQVLLQARLIDRVRDRDHQVGHFIRPDGLLLDGFLGRRDFDVVA